MNKDHVMILNILWTFFLSAAIGETILYFTTLVNLEKDEISYKTLLRLPHNDHPKSLNWLDLWVIIFLLWTIGYLTARIPTEFEPAQKNGTKYFQDIDFIIASKIFVIAFTNFISRFLLGFKSKKWRELILPTLIGLAGTFLIDWITEHSSMEKVYYIVTWVFIFAVFMQYALRYKSLPSAKHSDLGWAKDFSLITLMFILGSILYPALVTLSYENKYIFFAIAISIAMIAVAVVIIELLYPRSKDGTFYCQEILKHNGLEDSEMNVRALRTNIINTHLLIRTVVCLLCGVTAPFCFYVINFVLARR